MEKERTKLMIIGEERNSGGGSKAKDVFRNASDLLLELTWPD